MPSIGPVRTVLRFRTTNMDPYISWLHKKHFPLFEAAGIWWARYRHALVPASPRPEPVDLTTSQARKLLHESGMLFVRYFSRTYTSPTDFWYTECNKYDD